LWRREESGTWKVSREDRAKERIETGREENGMKESREKRRIATIMSTGVTAPIVSSRTNFSVLYSSFFQERARREGKTHWFTSSDQSGPDARGEREEVVDHRCHYLTPPPSTSERYHPFTHRQRKTKQRNERGETNQKSREKRNEGETEKKKEEQHQWREMREKKRKVMGGIITHESDEDLEQEREPVVDGQGVRPSMCLSVTARRRHKDRRIWVRI
jgi:hypothetical protein